MIKYLFLIPFSLITFASQAQLKMEGIKYSVLASAQRDSAIALSSVDTPIVKTPTYLGGRPALKKKIEKSLNLCDWKKKKAGTYTVYVTQNWKQVSVSADTKKAKDIDLVLIATALKTTAPLWSSLTVDDKAISRYTLKIEFQLVK